MPGAARMIGRWSAKMRSAATSLSQAVAEDENLREINKSVSLVKNDIAQTKSEIFGAMGETDRTVREARAELREIGREPEPHPAVTAESVEPAEEKPQPDAVSGHSDFMNRPLQWFDEDEKTAQPAVAGETRVIRLDRRILLPGPVSKLVCRRSILLEKHQALHDDAVRSMVLEAPANRGFCRIRCVPRSSGADPACVKAFRLSRARTV